MATDVSTTRRKYPSLTKVETDKGRYKVWDVEGLWTGKEEGLNLDDTLLIWAKYGSSVGTVNDNDTDLVKGWRRNVQTEEENTVGVETTEEESIW